KPPMTEQEMTDLEAFLAILSDDYKPPGPDHAELQRALEQYLARQGNVCLGKFEWPIQVTAEDVQRRTRDAIPMPVLDKLGLVASQAQDTQSVRRYELTEAGRRFFIDKDSTTEGPGGSPVEHHKDFCGARVTLDKIVAWSKPSEAPDSHEVTLTYTYHVIA